MSNPWTSLFPGETDPDNVDTDGDGFVDGETDFVNDPTVADYGDGSIAPWGAPDTVTNVADSMLRLLESEHCEPGGRKYAPRPAKSAETVNYLS